MLIRDDGDPIRDALVQVWEDDRLLLLSLVQELWKAVVMS